MESTDLMLDDWVIDTYTGKPMRVQVVKNTVGKGLDPIPLTPDIFEKNGFKDIDKEEHCEGYDIYWTNGDGYSINVQDLHLHYVHELQHALRLCGIDKEIVL